MGVSKRTSRRDLGGYQKGDEKTKKGELVETKKPRLRQRERGWGVGYSNH